MVRKYTAEELITSFRDVGMVPSTSSLGSEDADVLKKIDEAIATILVPKVIAMREEYFVARKRYDVTTSRIRIPHRAMYGKLRDLWFIDSNGERIQMTLKAPEMLDYFTTDNSADTVPLGYMLEGDYVLLLPEENTSFDGDLEFVFFMRPNQMVKTAEYVNVSSVVDEYTVEWTYGTTLPTSWAAGTAIDLHSPYSGAELKSWDLTIHAITVPVAPATPGQIEFHEKIDGSVYGTKPVAIGDYICAAETCAIPPLPREYHPVISRAAALYFSESVSDIKGAQLHGELLQRNLTDAVTATESRVEGKPMKITGRRSFIGW